MPDIDVRDLARESLASVPFPVDRGEAFRVYIAERVHQGIWQHASADTSHEICGVLVGTWAKDADGPFAQVTEFIRCDNATQKFAEVTFTHESWAQINGEMDTKYQNLRIIGWYHSHPNFGIFLSDRDCFIQEHFFSGPGQVALVVDPVRKTEGIFEWRRGKPTPIHHYWVGNRVQVGISNAPPVDGMPMGAVAHGGESATDAPRRDDSPYSSVFVMLIAILMLLIGYLYGGQRSVWEQERLIAGTVAHYGLWKLYKPGFEALMNDAIAAQQKIADDLRKITEQLPNANAETRLELEKKTKERREDLGVTIDRLKLIAARYGLNDSERAEMLRLVGDRLKEVTENPRESVPLTKLLEPPPAKTDSKKPATEAKKAEVTKKPGTSKGQGAKNP